MRGLTRLLLTFGLLLTLTSADSGLSRLLGINTAAPFLAVPALAWALALVFLERRGLVRGETTLVSGEIAAIFIVLYAPVFIAFYWIQAAPSNLDIFGSVPIANILTAILIFQIAIYFEPDELQWIARACLLFYGASVIADLLSRGLLFSALLARPAGFLVNPNDGGAQLVALLVPSLDWQRARVTGLVWCLAALVLIALTLSRSALLACVFVTFAFMAVVFVRSPIRTRLIIVSVLVVLAVSLGAISSFPRDEKAPFVTNQQSQQRVYDIAEIVSGDTSTISEDPRYAIYDYWKTVAVESPLIGHGSGYSVSGHGTWFMGQYDQGPHNMFIARLVDQGALGIFTLGLFLLIWIAFFLTRRDMAGVMFVLTFILISVFSHNTTDRRSLLSLFAFSAAVSVKRQLIGSSPARTLGELRQLAL